MGVDEREADTVTRTACLLPVALALGLGCGDDAAGFLADAGAPDAGTQPRLGAQIDRVGRPGINAMLNMTFAEDADERDGARDGYNRDSDSAGWAERYGRYFAASVAFIDALDEDGDPDTLPGCGNDLFGYGRYAITGAILADDKLYVNAAITGVPYYLAVEKTQITSSGGRHPSQDVFDFFFLYIVGGYLEDGIDADPDGAPSDSFPFLLRAE